MAPPVSKTRVDSHNPRIATKPPSYRMKYTSPSTHDLAPQSHPPAYTDLFPSNTRTPSQQTSKVKSPGLPTLETPSSRLPSSLLSSGSNKLHSKTFSAIEAFLKWIVVSSTEESQNGTEPVGVRCSVTGDCVVFEE